MAARTVPAAGPTPAAADARADHPVGTPGAAAWIDHPAATPAAQVLALQRRAGNAAICGLIARQRAGRPPAARVLARDSAWDWVVTATGGLIGLGLGPVGVAQAAWATRKARVVTSANVPGLRDNPVHKKLTYHFAEGKGAPLALTVEGMRHMNIVFNAFCVKGKGCGGVVDEAVATLTAQYDGTPLTRSGLVDTVPGVANGSPATCRPHIEPLARSVAQLLAGLAAIAAADDGRPLDSRAPIQPRSSGSSTAVSAMLPCGASLGGSHRGRPAPASWRSRARARPAAHHARGRWTPSGDRTG